MKIIRRIALLTLAVPWDARPANGLYNIAQAKALRDVGVDTEIFTVAPALPRAAHRLGGACARQLSRPARYEREGVPINTLRCPVAYPRTVRVHAVPRCPSSVSAAFHLGTRHALGSALARFHPDALIVHGMMPWCHAARQYAHTRGIPAIVLEHSADDVQAALQHGSLARLYTKHASAFEAVVAVNARLTQTLSDIGVPNAIRLTNGITQRPHIVNAHDRRGFTVLTAGQFIERKGHADLVAACAEADVPGLTLRIVGTPPPALQRQIESDLPSCVEILPMLDNARLMAEMARADLFALPSWSESFGLVFAEALSVGTPVLATTDTGMADHIRPGEHGWLVPPRDVAAIAAGIRAAARMTAAERRRMGQRGRRLALATFSWSANARAVLDVLAGACTESSDAAASARAHAAHAV